MSTTGGIILNAKGGSSLERYANLAAFPPDGDLKTLYLAEDTSILYYWTGSVYIDTKVTNVPVDGVVANFAALPQPPLSYIGQTYLVENWSIVNFIPRLSGLYLSDGINWNRRSDKVIYSLLPFTSTNKVIKTNNTDREIVETDIDIDDFNNLDVKQGTVTASTFIGALRGEVCFEAKAGEAITIGDPVYISNFDAAGNKPIVGIADANDANKMPAFGLAKTTVNQNAAVSITTFGTLSNVDTSSFSLGDILYISTSGTLTNQKPTGESSLIQNIGKVQRVHATNGSIKVGGAGRTNDTPNLNDGNVFIGNTQNEAEARSLQSADINFNGLNIGFITTITNNRIKIGDSSFYIDRGNINFPLLNFDTDDYIGYNRLSNYWAWVIGGSEVSRIDATGYKLSGNQAISIGGQNSDTPPAIPLAQVYLGGAHNSGFNLGTKVWFDGYDNETPIDVAKFTDENGNNDFNIRSGVNYPILTSRGQTIFSEANRTTYTADLNDMKTAGIYMVGIQAANLPPQRDTNESTYVLVVYTWGSSNGVQTLYCTDRDGTNDFVAMYNRTWESISWTNWNCFSSERVVLADLNVSIGASYTNFNLSKSYAYITNTYKQLIFMITTSIHNSTIALDAATLNLNTVYEIGKFSNRYITIKTPTSTSSGTWQAFGGSVTITNIKLIGYR